MVLSRLLKLLRTICTFFMYILYFAIGIINIIVLVHAIAIKFHVGLLFGYLISIPIGYTPLIGSILTVWGGCVWLGLSLLKSIAIFLILPYVIMIILGLLIQSEDNNE